MRAATGDGGPLSYVADTFSTGSCYRTVARDAHDVGRRSAHIDVDESLVLESSLQEPAVDDESLLGGWFERDEEVRPCSLEGWKGQGREL